MPRTQAQLITAVRDRLDEATEGEWTDKNLRRWINQGCRDLCRDLEVLDSTTVFAMTAGDGTQTGPSDMIRCSHAEWQNDSDTSVYPLQWRDFNAMDPIWFADRAVTSSRPQFFTITGFVPTTQFRLYPIPAEDGNLSIKYYRLPVELAVDTAANANTTLDIPEGWDDAVESYVEYMALRKDRDPRWQEAKSLYDETKEQLRGLSRSLSNQPGQVVPQVAGGGLPGWLVDDGGWA
jgi:uncharacterized protein DUF6682